MAHFYESISSKQVNPIEENDKIRFLFTENKHYFSMYALSLANYIDNNYFRDLKISTNHLNIASFFADSLRDAKSELEEFLYYCESVLSILTQLFNSFHNHYSSKVNEVIREISKVINYDLNKMNLSAKTVETEEFGTIVIIIPKDELVENVLMNTKDEDIKDYLIEYKSSHNDGNIKAKEEILKLLSTHIEGITKNKLFGNTNKELFSDVDFLFNNLYIRHNQEVKDYRFYNYTLKNREEWLDLAFREALLVFSSVTEYDDHKLIDEAKVAAGLKEKK